MCATSCSFCKKSASKLVSHYLCDCCLVHLECCEATPENNWASFAKKIISGEDAKEQVVCEICLEKYPEDELEEHQRVCMARLVFRCSACDGDYVSKEGLWNHLDLHEIVEESKELHYQEMRVTYKMYQCFLCNDHRCYQEGTYWRHVHEDHDGFYLRCLDCGSNFRSEKQKADHHCNAGEQCNDDSITIDRENIDSKGLKIEEKIAPVNLSKCSYCDKAFNNAYSLTRHVELYHQLFKCNICEITVNKKNQLRHHKLMNHKEPKYKCHVCSKAFHFHSSRQRHMSKHEKEKKVPCTLCSSIFKSVVGLSWHINQFHQSSQANTETSKESNEQKEELPADNISDRQVCSANEADKQLHIDRSTPQPSGTNLFVANEMPPCNPPQESHSKDDLPAQPSKVKLEIDVNTPHPEEDRQFVAVEKQSCKDCNTYKWKCTHCPKECRDESELSRHYLYCHKPVECEMCKKSFQGISNYRYHKLVSHTEPQHKCPHCEQRFHLKMALGRHLVVHQSKRDVPCGFCNLKFKSIDHRQRHLKRMHSSKRKPKQIPRDRTSPLTCCPLCEDNFENEPLLCQHVEKVHELTICTLCGLTFTNTVVLKNHKHKRHSIPKYTCNQCNQTFNVRREFYQHMSAHEKQSKYDCKICNLRCENNLALRNHMAIDHNIEPKRVVPQLTCPICGITVHGHVRLAYHKIKCNNEPRIQCSQCPKKFLTKSNYFNHMQSHKSLRTYQCNYCSLKYKRMYHLKAHIDSRHGDQSLHVLQVQNKTQDQTCDDGSLATPGEEIDIKHEILVNATPITETECSQCHQTFSDANELQEHMKVSHPAMRECLICGLSFSNAARFRHHKLMAHTRPRLKCSQCPKMFHYHYMRDLHELTHKKNAGKPAKLKNMAKTAREECNLCQRTFENESKLNRHVFSMHRSSEIQCDICDLKFTSRGKWNYHKLKAHTAPKFNCTHCDMKFHARNGLRAHLAVHNRASEQLQESNTEENNELCSVGKDE